MKLQVGGLVIGVCGAIQVLHAGGGCSKNSSVTEPIMAASSRSIAVVEVPRTRLEVARVSLPANALYPASAPISPSISPLPSVRRCLPRRFSADQHSLLGIQSLADRQRVSHELAVCIRTLQQQIIVRQIGCERTCLAFAYHPHAKQYGNAEFKKRFWSHFDQARTPRAIVQVGTVLDICFRLPGYLSFRRYVADFVQYELHLNFSSDDALLALFFEPAIADAFMHYLTSDLMAAGIVPRDTEHLDEEESKKDE